MLGPEDEKFLEVQREFLEFHSMLPEKRERILHLMQNRLLELDKGIMREDGKIYFRDRIWMVTKDHLYED